MQVLKARRENMKELLQINKHVKKKRSVRIKNLVLLASNPLLASDPDVIKESTHYS